MHILNLELLNDKYCLEKGLKIDLKPLTLLVGDQGCGKSTLLNMLQTQDNITAEVSAYVKEHSIETFYFDSEKMNPRMVDPEMYTKPNGDDVGIGFYGALATKFQSHGETLIRFTIDQLTKINKECVVFLDEPESALSLRNQFLLADLLKNLHNKNIQCIVATHCLPVIESVDEVYSLEHKKWMKSTDFIKLNK